MPTNSNNQGLLSSWKEIARYLNCDERTCRRYELNFGLPIHRMEGTAKSRVYAYKEEIDSWRREKLNGVLNANGKELSAAKRRVPKAVKMLVWLFPLLVVIIAAVIFLFRPSPGQPADFMIQGSKLIVLDKNGKELWDFDTGLPDLADDKFYRERFQVTSMHLITGGKIFPNLMMRDIDSDGQTEVIFSTQTKSEFNEGEIFCFNASGEIKWRKRTGRAVEFGGRLYSGDFRVEQGLTDIDIDDDGNLEILIFAAHQPHSPSQLLILDMHGKVTGDFFNFGQMHDFLSCDLDNDGRNELLIVGQNDEYGKGCLIVFDPGSVNGCSPQVLEYSGMGLSAGTMKHYILFPRTNVDRIIYPLKESIARIDHLQNNRIQLTTTISHLFFELDSDFRLQDVKGSDSFRLQHRELKAAGKITSVLDDAYYESLKKGVLYWDGEQWTSTPTINRNWNNPR